MSDTTAHTRAATRGRRAGRSRRTAVVASLALLAPLVPALAGTGSSVASQAATTSAAAASTAGQRAPYCGLVWGSDPERTGPGLMWTGRVSGLRAGQHPCWDRLVVDVAPGAGALGYDVRYVDQVVGPSGLPVAVSGGARLQVTVNAPATSAVPASTLTWSGWRTFRQARFVSSFEGHTDIGLGVRARLPMRAFVLTDPDGGRRLVVDVAHAW